MIPIISIVAFSGTGKTTYMEKLIPELKNRGIRLAVVKHDAHRFEIDKEGKDSYRITKAGADITGLVSEEKSVLMENRPRSIDDLFRKIRDVDVILTEGYKHGPWPKIMLYREEVGKGLPCDPCKCFAVVSDDQVEGALVQYCFEEIEKVADLIEDYIKPRQFRRNPLQKISFLEEVEQSTLDGLLKDGRVETFSRHEILINAKKSVECVYIQLTGKSFVYNLTHNGDRKVIFILGPGNLLNDHVVNEHCPSLYCETMEKSEIFVIPTYKFVRWMKKDFNLTKAVLQVQEWKMWRMGHQLKNTTSSIALERKLAAKLWKLSRDFPKENPEGIEIDMSLSITFLSDMLGAPRETTSRICKSLSEMGLIKIDKKRIIILDPKAMSLFYRKGKKK